MERNIPDTGSIVVVNIPIIKELQGVKGIVIGHWDGVLCPLQIRLLIGKEVYCAINEVEVIDHG